VDDVTKLEKYLHDYGKLIEVAKKIHDRLPTPAHFKALKPPALGRLAPFMTGELSITGIDALIKKELRPVEKYFLDILTTLEITAKIVGDVTTLGTVVAVQGTRIGILKAYKEYTKEVGGMLSSGGLIAAYQGELRQAETAILDGLAALNHYAANNQYVDAFNDAMGGYKNQNSLFRVVKAGIVGKFEAGNPPLSDGRMFIDVSIAGTGWSAQVDWDFTKGMKGIFDALKIELVTFLKEETS
jgi:hypothetical protein